MDGNTIASTVKMILLIIGAVIILWLPASRFLSKIQASGGMHDLDLACLISKEDRDSLTRAEYKQTEKMSYPELKAYLKKRFPNSVPEISEDMENTQPSQIRKNGRKEK
jgi:hypothetical protein